MKIIVPLKQVPETKSVRMDEKTGTVIREGVEAIINPLDLYAIEIAVQLKEKHGGETIAISMGPPKAEEALREAMAMGMDSAILISDRAFAGSDTWATSYILSEAVKKISDFSLIICGERATDGDTGQVGPGIASALAIPALTYISRIEKVTSAAITVHRLVEDGNEILESSMPCLLTVVKEISSPRLPTLRGKQRSRKASVTVWNIADLNIEASKVGLSGSPTNVLKIFKPKIARECEMFHANSETKVIESADHLMEFIHKQNIS